MLVQSNTVCEVLAGEAQESHEPQNTPLQGRFLQWLKNRGSV